MIDRESFNSYNSYNDKLYQSNNYYVCNFPHACSHGDLSFLETAVFAVFKIKDVF